MYWKEKEKTRQHQVLAWPKSLFQNIGRGRPDPTKKNVLDWEIGQILGSYLGEQRMDEVKKLLDEKITVLNDFDMNTEKLRKKINKRKSWTSTWIDGVHFWWSNIRWKKLAVTQKPLFDALKRINWWPTGRTSVLHEPCCWFYDYKKVYDKVHQDWMLRVYEWIGIPKEVLELIYQLMSKWKTRLKICNERENVTSR